MEDSNKINSDVKLQIGFPKSKEDHRLQLVDINGAIFSIVYSPLESLGPIHLHCEDWSLVLLSSIKSKENISISAKNIICLNEIISEEGNVNIHASNRLIKFTDLIKSVEKSEIGERGKFQFDEDIGLFLYYYRLFEGIVSNVHSESSDSSQAQQNFISILCSLANKIEDKPGDLNLEKVLGIWDIPSIKS